MKLIFKQEETEINKISKIYKNMTGKMVIGAMEKKKTENENKKYWR